MPSGPCAPALGMQAAMERDQRRACPRPRCYFDLRVGLNTGEVLAGAVGDAYTVIGDTVNVAARLQAAGRPGSVTVGERTDARDERRGRYEPRIGRSSSRASPSRFRRGRPGSAAAQPVRRASRGARVAARGARRRAGPARAALRARGARGPAPPRHRWSGRPAWASRACCASCERGWRARSDAPALREGRCLPYGSGIVYWALGEVIRTECRNRGQRLGRRRVEEALDPYPRAAGRARRARAASPTRRAQDGAASAACSASGPGRAVPGGRGPRAAARVRSSRRCARCVEAWPCRRPLVFAFEDIHWADDGMLDRSSTSRSGCAAR